MKLIIQNQANIPNKYVRFIKWRLRKINRKFSAKLLYVEIFIRKEGTTPTQYSSVIKMGIRGQDLLISKKAPSMKLLWRKCAPIVERQIRKWKTKGEKQIKAIH